MYDEIDGNDTKDGECFDLVRHAISRDELDALEQELTNKLTAEELDKLNPIEQEEEKKLTAEEADDYQDLRRAIVARAFKDNTEIYLEVLSKVFQDGQ